jgi:plasmid stabilization system protein ParE
MKFAIRRPKLVEEDQLAAALWYDEQQLGLGDDFLDESETVITALSDNALFYSVRFADVRCVRLRRFRQYGVYYLVRGEEIILLAIHHASRHPRRLRERREQLG